MESNNRRRKGNSAAAAPRRRIRAPTRSMIPHPPLINPQLKQTMRLRFTCKNSAAVQTVITFQNLLDAVLVATSAVAAVDVYDTVKLKSVEVWAVPVQGAAPQAVRVQFGGGIDAAGSGRIYADTSMGVEPAYVKAVPESRSQTALWHVSNAEQAFILDCPVAAVIDVALSYSTVFNIAPVATAAVVGATPGDVYFRGLDGVAAAGTNFPADAPNTR